MYLNIEHIPIDNWKRKQIKLEPTNLTIHSTANESSTAQNERDNLAREDNYVQASFHYVVDDTMAIECMPTNEVAYHAGCVAGNYGSVGIEICESGDREQTILNATKLTAIVLKDLNLTTADIVQHYDWTGKDCPRILRTDNNWSEFMEKVEKEVDKQAVTTGIEAITYLNEQGIINSPDYWLSALTVVKNLDLLLVQMVKNL